MNRAIGLVGVAGIGAGLMYLFDPDRGKRRRAEIRNKAKHINRVATDTLGKTQRDLRNRLLGVICETKSLVSSERVSDEVLEERVRSKMGRVVSHPHAIQVKAHEGLITLSGPILSAEELPLVAAVGAMRGVKNIENVLELHQTPDDVPTLLGGRRRMGERLGPFRAKRSPTSRLLTGVAGGALTIYGAKRRGAPGPVISSIGLGLLACTLTNLGTKRSIGTSSSG